MRNLVYIIGEPGVGKSTAIETLTLGMTFEQREEVCPHIVYDGGELVEIGRRRSTFSGTDALAMNIIDKALAFMGGDPGERVVAEGARLANRRFLSGCVERGWDVTVLNLYAMVNVARGRREERGSGQDQKWIAGRITASWNLANSQIPGVNVRDFNTTAMSKEEVAAKLADTLDLTYTPMGGI